MSNDNKLTVNFTDGFNLLTNQTDFVVAFTEVNNNGQDKSAESVKLTMEHQLAKVKLIASTTSTTTAITVTKVQVKDISSIANAATFSLNENNKISASWSLSSDKSGVYTPYNEPDGGITLTEYDQTIFDNLLVFPEKEKIQLTIVVSYKEIDNNLETFANVEKKGTLEVLWEAGKTYTYKVEFKPGPGIVITPSRVAGWGTLDDIDHNFTD